MSLDRTLLLPSGIGIVAPWLVIAPPGNAPVWLDLRVLDCVELLGPNEQGEDEESRRWALLLVCGELEVALDVAEGRAAAEKIALAATPYTRDFGGTPPTEPESSATSGLADRGENEVVGKLTILSSTDPEAPSTPDHLAGREIALDLLDMSIGRTDDNDIVIEHRSISRRHVRVTRENASAPYTIIDLEATNPIRINGEARGTAQLRDGDVVDFGHVRMRFEGPGKRLLAPPKPRDASEFLFVGGDAVLLRDPYIQIGATAFRINEVQDYALQGANIPLTGGRLVQAALATMVVAVSERERDEADPPFGMIVRRQRVRGVVPESIAARAGVWVGDELLSIAMASARLDRTDAVARLHVRVQRTGKPIALVVPLGSVDWKPWATLLDQPAPTFVASRIDGGSLALGDLAGRVVVLGFCETSSDEWSETASRLSALAERYPELRVLGVSVEAAADLEVVLATAALRFPLVRDVDGSITRSYDAISPMLVAIDKSGVIRKVELGVGAVETLEKDLVLLLAS